MSRCALIPVLLIAAAPIAAQNFEGTITMRLSGPNSTPMEMKVHHADGMQAMVMSGAMGMPNAEMRMVINPTEGRMTTFVSMPGMPGGGKFKTVSSLGGNSGTEVPADITVTKLGTSQTIAGMRCDDYEIVSRGESMRMCATEALGRFSMPAMGGPGQQGSSPAWARAFGNRPFFPLKVWGGDNTVAMEVTKVERGTPDRALFDENTPGYITAPGMPGMRRN